MVSAAPIRLVSLTKAAPALTVQSSAQKKSTFTQRLSVPHISQLSGSGNSRQTVAASFAFASRISAMVLLSAI